MLHYFIFLMSGSLKQRKYFMFNWYEWFQFNNSYYMAK